MVRQRERWKIPREKEKCDFVKINKIIWSRFCSCESHVKFIVRNGTERKKKKILARVLDCFSHYVHLLFVLKQEWDWNKKSKTTTGLKNIIKETVRDKFNKLGFLKPDEIHKPIHLDKHFKKHKLQLFFS